MRILFTTIERRGHFQPLVPIAKAAVAAGHAVTVACAATLIPVVEQAGFRAFPAGFDERGRTTEMLFPGFRTVPTHVIAGWAIPTLYAGVYAAAMTPDLLTITHDWAPDLIVRDAMEFGGCLAAEVSGLPHAVVRTGSTTSRYVVLRKLVAEPLARLREINGLPPDPDVAMPFRYLHLAPEPPGFLLPGEVPPPTTHYLRPIAADRTDDAPLPAWIAALPDRPVVHASLGTVFNRTPGLNEAIIAALRDESVELILASGRDQDPAQFGQQPANVHIERYLPHSMLLPHCDAFVTHGGYGSVMAGLNAGLPLVVIPIGADQPYNADCCAALRVGRVIAPDQRTPEAIRAAVRMVLDDPSYRVNAERVRATLAALPGPEEGVRLLERLAIARQPLL